MSENNGGNPRLDRIEAILETIVKVQADMQQEHQMLLRAQVGQADEIEKSKLADQSLRKSLNELAAAGRHTEESLNSLIAIVDEIIRKPGAS